MKGFWTIAGILLCSIFSTTAQERIEYDHRAVDKEIKNIYDVKDFTIQELVSTDTLPVNPMGRGKYFSVKNYVSQIGYLYIGRVNSCRASGCSLPVEDTTDVAFEYFDYLIVLDTLGVVRSVRVFNYQSTHGYEICSRGWLKQFQGYSGDRSLSVGKEIDAISGATISTQNITYDIEQVTRSLDEYIIHLPFIQAEANRN